MIREGKTFQLPSAMQTGAKYGMQLLNDALQKLVSDGKVDANEALDRAADKEDFAKRMQAMGIAVDYE